LASPNALSTTSFTALGPQPERMTGCSGCFDYTLTQGRVNAIAVDPTTTTNGSVVAYIGSVGGGVWKTTNCCSNSTTWSVTTDDPLISTTSIDTVTLDPNDHNNVVAGTKKGLYFSYDGGVNWTGPCTTNTFNTQRQDITGLELTNMGAGVTRIIAAVGTRGFPTFVQYDLGQNGANGIY